MNKGTNINNSFLAANSFRIFFSQLIWFMSDSEDLLASLFMTQFTRDGLIFFTRACCCCCCFLLLTNKDWAIIWEGTIKRRPDTVPSKYWIEGWMFFFFRLSWASMYLTSKMTHLVFQPFKQLRTVCWKEQVHIECTNIRMLLILFSSLFFLGETPTFLQIRS